MATGSFYAYYESKADIFTAVIRQINHDVRAAQAAALNDAVDNQRARERASFRAYFDLMSQRPWIYRIVREAGRGADQEKAVVFRCKHCGERVLDLDSIGIGATCRKSGEALHSCSQCAFFDTSARFECSKPIPVRIVSKKAGNECTFYAPAKTFDLTGVRGSATPDDARAAFDALFKK